MTTYNITIKKGTTFKLPLVLRQKGCEVAEDLSGAIITGVITNSGSPATQTSFSVVEDDLASGSFTLRLTAGVTSGLNLDNDTGTYSIKVNYTGSPEDIDEILSGRVFVV